MSWETSSCLNPFYDALRDRLVKYFGNSDGALQPKLVSVTGTEKGCGVSAIAAGVAIYVTATDLVPEVKLPFDLRDENACRFMQCLHVQHHDADLAGEQQIADLIA